MDRISKPLPRAASAEATGLSSSVVTDFAVRMDELTDIHSFMILRNGTVVAEAWKAPYSASEPHMLYSLSKSFTSTAAGLAIGQGLLSLNTRVLELFPNEAPTSPDVNLQKMELRHLLCMGTGHHEDTTGRLRGDNGRDDVNSAPQSWVRAFLSLPVEHEPGTYFVYNSGASYMVSAMVQKAVGCTVLQYLEEKLFTPLGIVGASWDVCPDGVNVGGWGLWLKTEDIARFGQLYLQDGVWNGVRILPEGWVSRASSRHIANGDNPESDWNQGYGFQFWRCRHNAYRGDGAFGQYCVVMPDQNMVVAITSGLGDMQTPLNIIWDTLVLNAKSAPLPIDTTAATALKHRLNRMSIATSPASNVTKAEQDQLTGAWEFAANDDKVESVEVAIAADEIKLNFHLAGKESCISAGTKGRWMHGHFAFLETADTHVGATATWLEKGKLEVKICYTRTPFVRTLRLDVNDTTLTMEIARNVSFEGTGAKTYVASRRSH